MQPITLLGFVAVIACTVAANLMLKLGASVPEAQRVLFGLLGWKSAAGLALFGCDGIVYALLLRGCCSTSPRFSQRRNLSVSSSRQALCWESRYRRPAGSGSAASVSGSCWSA